MQSSKPSRRRLGREALRAWYAPRRDAYPWRGSHDPYAVWVSEVMLQQTQAAGWCRRSGRSCAASRPSERSPPPPVRDVVAGVGWPRLQPPRGRGSRRPPASIVRDHGGRIPRDPATLRELPGVGPYTAAAVASMGFGEPVAVVDTNVRRVVSRVHLGVDGHEVPAKEVWGLAEGWLDRDDPVTWNQALMDLGREVCRPEPRCDVCPLAGVCRFRRDGAAATRGPSRQGPFEGSTRQVRGAVVQRVAVTPVVDACAARLGDRVPGRSCRCGGRNAFGRRARRARCAGVSGWRRDRRPVNYPDEARRSAGLEHRHAPRRRRARPLATRCRDPSPGSAAARPGGCRDPRRLGSSRAAPRATSSGGPAGVESRRSSSDGTAGSSRSCSGVSAPSPHASYVPCWCTSPSRINGHGSPSRHANAFCSSTTIRSFGSRPTPFAPSATSSRLVRTSSAPVSSVT